ncbi:uncharacterized protein YbjT (DUF2867 family) [Microterricola gilva]|uniref:Uncharacterized protein YbjT (DUF2867 family) n=1 Tax=Microterricola gilva TaxID=393267 RepID=A0A4Q8AN37_9MICO|nr:NAD(P)H-binding protein [Microterricola gilva]RZU65997.1 uncharacterized protein YbjT (DUF2867 family) [Microterricola gilva]
MTRIGVTGSTGHIGGLVARALVASPTPDQTLRLIVRDPLRVPALRVPGPVADAAEATSDAAFDAASGGDSLDAVDAAHQAIEVVQASYDSVTAVDLGELDVVFMVSAAESATRREQHHRFVRAAMNGGVPHIVYTSFAGADPGATFTLAQDHAYTEELIRESGMNYTFLRDNLYLDVLPHFADEQGVIRGPAGEGRVAAVARADVADAAVAVIRDLAAHVNATYTLTGPAALTLAEIAAATGLRFENETLEEAYASRARYGAEPWQVDAWVSTYTAIADGSLAAVSPDVQRLTGHPARGLAELFGA